MMAKAKTAKLYLNIFLVNCRSARSHPIELVARFGFFALILAIFHLLWSNIALQKQQFGLNAQTMVWYLFLTEWIILSVPHVHLDIEEDIKTGSISYHLIRPLSYLHQKTIEALAEMLRRMSVFALAGSCFAALLTGSIPSIGFFLVGIPLGILAGLLAILFLCSIGISALWIHETSPLYLIWQKLVFILGGLLFPLSIYPEWLFSIAQHLPFAAMLYLPAHAATSLEASAILQALQQLIVWGLILTVAAHRLYDKAVQQFEASGG